MTQNEPSRNSPYGSDATKSEKAHSRDLTSGSDGQLHTLFATPAVFWQPRYTTPSPWLDQIPLLFWLIETVKPRTVVQFGLGDGVGYLALCQANQLLEKRAACFAVDNDDHPLRPDLLSEHNSCYSSFSIISKYDQFLSSNLDNLSIDMLVINSPITPEFTAYFQNEIAPQLSDSAIILAYETTVTEAAAHQILANYNPQITFSSPTPDSGTVNLVLFGPTQPAALRLLASQNRDQPVWLTAREIFGRLGRSIVADVCNRDLLAQQGASTEALKNYQKKLSACETEASEALAGEHVQIERQAELSAKIHDLEIDLAEINEINISLKAQSGGLTSQIRDLKLQLSESRAQHDARIEDIAILTGHFHKENSIILSKFENFVDENKALSNEIEELKINLSYISMLRDRMRNTFSWRITAPFRKIIRLFSLGKLKR